MKNIQLVWLLSFLAMLLSFSAQSQFLKVMTYNIRLDVASDGENAWEHRRFFMVTLIKFYEPDILGIQEGLPQQVLFLQKNLNPYKREGIGRERNGEGEASTIC